MDRWRWPVIGVWIVITVAGAVFGGALFGRLQDTSTNRPDSESAVAQHYIDVTAPEGATVVAVIQDRDVYDPGLVSNVTKIDTAIKALKGVKKVHDLYTEPGGAIGADNRSTTVVVELQPGLSDQVREPLEDGIKARLEKIEAPKVLVTGSKLAERAFAQQSVDDLAVGETVAFAALLVALVVIFGGVVAAGLPLAVAITAVTATLLALLGLSEATSVSQYSVNVVTLLGIGLAVDYSLLMVARFREERVTKDSRAAVIASTRTAGKAVCVSGLAVFAALLGLSTFAEPLLAAVAIGGAAVVLLTTIAALTLVPALLSVAHNKIPVAGAETWVTRLTGKVWSRPGKRRDGLLARLAAFAQKRPGGVALAVTVGLLVLAAPLLTAHFGNSDARALPRSNEARQAYDVMQKQFTGSDVAPVTVVVEADSGRADVRLLMNQLNRIPEVYRLELRSDVPAGSTIIDLTPKGISDGSQSRTLVTKVRALHEPFTMLVTGDSAKAIDYQDSILSRLPAAVGIVLIATLILMFLLTGSVVVPVKALLMNILTLLATLGVLVVVFQWGWGQYPLFFDSWGGLDLTTPVLLFVFVFGLSMDYEVFLLARIKEEYDRRPDTNRAVLAGIKASGRVVTAAAVSIVIVFLGFAAGGLVAVKEIGVGMTVAIVLDVTVVRGLLLPALMTMLDEVNWWAPAWMKRFRARLTGAKPTQTATAKKAPIPVG